VSERISLSIIIPVFNCLDLTKKCLESIEVSLKGVIDYEVIIVDDGSTDGTREFLMTLPEAPYRILLNQDKGNYSINNNRAAAIACGDLLCLLNNDTELPSGWLQPMLEGLKRYPDAGCIGNVQKIPATNRYDHFGICFPDWLTPQHYGQHLRKRPSEISGAASRWGAVTAACTLIKKSVFESVGGFDENYINGCEDIDLCLRLHAKGYWHYVAHESEILHHKGSSPGRKDHNDQNLVRFKETHSTYLREHLVERDRYLASKTYLRSAMAAPNKVNGGKLLNAIKSSLSGPSEHSLRSPECFF
jgi:GT2 family glycosyltransferase